MSRTTLVIIRDLMSSAGKKEAQIRTDYLQQREKAVAGTGIGVLALTIGVPWNCPRPAGQQEQEVWESLVAPAVCCQIFAGSLQVWLCYSCAACLWKRLLSCQIVNYLGSSRCRDHGFGLVSFRLPLFQASAFAFLAPAQQVL